MEGTHCLSDHTTAPNPKHRVARGNHQDEPRVTKRAAPVPEGTRASHTIQSILTEVKTDREKSIAASPRASRTPNRGRETGGARGATPWSPPWGRARSRNSPSKERSTCPRREGATADNSP